MSNSKITIPKIGEYWQGQGGIYAGIINHHAAGQQWHLILAVEHNSLAWDDEWESIDATDDYYDGHANTKALLKAGDCPAAEWAASVNADGHSDFYLPAQRELNLLCINTAHLCEPVWHWSSTQYSAISAWYQDFENGYQFIHGKGGKGGKRAVRAVRRINIED